ncbi:helix-turn-helix domain-containing protein [Portibacter lacus]|uniref:Insertion element IS150 protein InsJ-like helix-turn-helix domain-containing protein n=1 Tax=Portibacter lacus TaxID=1099794 RepID=A0AA37WDG6_9BACT|nr:helix-turn-helix domain-containing protein [Portibacter lacus]GLR16002.1 hypothetical protein GCM10007940_06170 [Portibacter lacus]
MNMKTTEKGTKKFTKKEKLQIIAEAKKNGVKVTLEKYALYPGTFYYWRKKLIVYGEEGLEHKRVKSIVVENIIMLKRIDNRILKILFFRSIKIPKIYKLIC